MLQAILIGLIVFIGKADYFIGRDCVQSVCRIAKTGKLSGEGSPRGS